MTRTLLLAPLFAPALLAIPAAADATLPEPVRAMIESAIADGNKAGVDAVAKAARKTNPDAGNEIDALIAAFEEGVKAKQEQEAREKLERLAAAGPLEFWKGEIEAGGSRSTGNTENLGLYGSLKLSREGIRWRHNLVARADLQTNQGRTTTERVLASWQPNYKFDQRLYAYGLTQYEHDRLLGFASRYTLGGGMGYRVVASPTATLDLEGGPAVRYTDFIGEPATTTAAGRASLKFGWKVTPSFSVAQSAAVFVESGNTNASATTSLDTKLIGALRARFSYNIQYERDAPPGRDPVDTLSRATLVYSF